METMSEALGLLIGNDRFINPLVVTSLCDLREEIAAELGRRSTGSETAIHEAPRLHPVSSARA